MRERQREQEERLAQVCTLKIFFRLKSHNKLRLLQECLMFTAIMWLISYLSCSNNTMIFIVLQ